MGRSARTSEALQILVRARDQGVLSMGMDSSRIMDPIKLLEEKMGIGYQVAYHHLKELERAGVVRVYRASEGQGQYIESVVVCIETLEEQTDSVPQRVKQALVQSARPSVTSGMYFVPAGSFQDLMKQGHINQMSFYGILQQMAKEGSIELLKKPNGRFEGVCFREGFQNIHAAV